MGKFAVIDTETTWNDEVMSIGIVVADDITFEVIDKFYYLISPECYYGGMFSSVLKLPEIKIDKKASRGKIIATIKKYLDENSIHKLFAYNAKFDYNHLRELQTYEWYDIMRLAAYKEYNLYIKNSDSCYSSGRLMTNYGVEYMFQLLSTNRDYREKHNALCDAEDEFKIIKYLGYDIDFYKNASIGANIVCYSGKTMQKAVSIYNEKITTITNNRIRVLKFDYNTFEAKYHCNKCGNEWDCRTAKFYKDLKCSCPNCCSKESVEASHDSLSKY